MYEIFEQLLQKFGVTAYQVSKATGISQSTLSSWKTRRNLLSGEKAKKIADYFGVTVDYLMTGKKEEPNIKVYDEHDNVIVLDDETLEIIDSLRSKPEMQILFSVSKNATKEDILKAVKIIEALKDDSEYK